MLKLKSDIEKSATLLILYFGPDINGNNDFIVYLVTLLSKKLINKDGYYDNKHISNLSRASFGSTLN